MPPHILVRIVVKTTQDGRIKKYFYKSKIEINEASIIFDKWSFIIKKHVFFRFNFNSTDYSYI